VAAKEVVKKLEVLVGFGNSAEGKAKPLLGLSGKPATSRTAPVPQAAEKFKSVAVSSER